MKLLICQMCGNWESILLMMLSSCQLNTHDRLPDLPVLNFIELEWGDVKCQVSEYLSESLQYKREHLKLLLSVLI